MTQCPRCGGQVFQKYEYDLIFGWLDKCLQCGEEEGETHELLVQFHYQKVPVGGKTPKQIKENQESQSSNRVLSRS